MALLEYFKLGRAGLEASFEINPSEFDPVENKISDQSRGADGTLNELTVARYRPPVRLPGNYMTSAFWNQLRQLAMVDDVPLVFEPMDSSGPLVMDAYQEPIIPVSTTRIKLRDNSYWKADRLRHAAGAPATVNIIGLWSAPSDYANFGGSGTNYTPRCSLLHDISAIDINPALPSLATVYVSYRAYAFAVRLYEVNSKVQGGWVNNWRYDFALKGA